VGAAACAADVSVHDLAAPSRLLRTGLLRAGGWIPARAATQPRVLAAMDRVRTVVPLRAPLGGDLLSQWPGRVLAAARAVQVTARLLTWLGGGTLLMIGRA